MKQIVTATLLILNFAFALQASAACVNVSGNKVFDQWCAQLDSNKCNARNSGNRCTFVDKCVNISGNKVFDQWCAQIDINRCDARNTGNRCIVQ